MSALASIPATGWRMADDGCALLARLVAEHRPELILECGSGRSTVALAEALREIGEGQVIALEHDLHYAGETMGWLIEHGLLAHASVRYAPIERDGWYSSSALAAIADVGMLVVDGPPGNVGPYPRKPWPDLLADRLAPGCVIVLDDIDRVDLYGRHPDEWSDMIEFFTNEKTRMGYWTWGQ